MDDGIAPRSFAENRRSKLNSNLTDPFITMASIDPASMEVSRLIMTAPMSKSLLEGEDWVLLQNETSDTGNLIVQHNVEAEGGHLNFTALLADTLIPGKGKPSRDQAVICEDGKITYVGWSDALPSNYKNVKFKKVSVLVPGL